MKFKEGKMSFFFELKMFKQSLFLNAVHLIFYLNRKKKMHSLAL